MRSLGLLAVIAVASVAPPAAVSSGSVEIAALQVTLRSRALYHGPVTGHAGPRTEAAVEVLQRRLGVSVDGVFGKETLARLYPYGRPVLGARLLSVGSKGYDVALLRVQLAFHGFPSGRFSSAFTARTARAVIRFQRFAGVPATGIAGPLTARALLAPPQASPIRLAWPVPTWITSGFGLRGARFHAGVDFAATLGQPVTAPGSGRVVYAGWRDGGWGNAVMIAHGKGVRSLVAHLSRVDAHVGDTVRVGEAVGLAGTTGESSGPHVHLEVRVRAAYVDPMTALG